MKKIISTLALLLVLISSKTIASNQFYSKAIIDSTKNEYTVFNKSFNIESVVIRKSKKTGNKLYITVGKKSLDVVDNNVTAVGLPGKSQSQEMKNKIGPIFNHIEVLKGGYTDISVEKKSSTQNVYIIKNINFPLRLKMQAGTEFVDFELKQEGNWDITINYKNI